MKIFLLAVSHSAEWKSLPLWKLGFVWLTHTAFLITQAEMHYSEFTVVQQFSAAVDLHTSRESVVCKNSNSFCDQYQWPRYYFFVQVEGSELAQRIITLFNGSPNYEPRYNVRCLGEYLNVSTHFYFYFSFDGWE